MGGSAATEPINLDHFCSWALISGAKQRVLSMKSHLMDGFAALLQLESLCAYLPLQRFFDCPASLQSLRFRRAQQSVNAIYYWATRSMSRLLHISFAFFCLNGQPSVMMQRRDI